MLDTKDEEICSLKLAIEKMASNETRKESKFASDSQTLQQQIMSKET